MTSSPQTPRKQALRVGHRRRRQIISFDRRLKRHDRLYLTFAHITPDLPQYELAMAPLALDRKRKASDRSVKVVDADPAAADSLPVADLDGILSEDDLDAESDADSAEFYASSGDEEDTEDSEEDIHSDDLPSGSDSGEDDGIREQIRQLKEPDIVLDNADLPGPFDPVVGTLEHGDDRPNYRVTTDANGNPRYVYREIDPSYDSDDSDAPQTTNTIGDIPLTYYDAYPHIGYDIDGKKVMRPAKGEALDALLDSIDIPEGWTGLTDPATGKPLQLSKEELEVLRHVTRNEVPADGYDPYPDMVTWFTDKEEVMPLSAAPEPKRRFIPSKHEAKRVMKLVKAIKEGRIQPYKPPKTDEERDAEDDRTIKRYDLWADEQPRADHPMNMPAPKLPPPGYAESYHPPPEYLPDEGERKAWEEAEPEDRDRDFLPADYSALRKVPGYARFVKEKFERCLDLYLAPRVRRSKLNIDPESLLPKLPSPDELRPFPTACATVYRGHKGRVRTVSVDPSGTYIASGGDDGTLRVWELLSGRQLWSVELSREDAISTVRWRPGKDALVLAAASGETMFFIVPSMLCTPDQESLSRAVLDTGFGHATGGTNGAENINKPVASTWGRPTSDKLLNAGVLLTCSVRHPIRVINWHRRGEYISSVSPAGSSQAIAIHNITKHLTQHPFRRLRGLAQTCAFHPSKPLFFIATRQSIRIYDLQQQKLHKDLKPGARWISSIDVHPHGNALVVGSYDRRLLFHDLDLGQTPYKTLRYHQKAVRAVAFHQNADKYPLFADASDDGTLQIFHGKMVNDSLENATIVPLKVLRGHKVTGDLGVLDVAFHPREPWLVSAGADGTMRLWC